MKEKFSPFIKERLEQIREKLPQMSFRCEFDQFDYTYTVEVLPIEDFKKNKEYAVEEVRLRKDFEEKVKMETQEDYSIGFTYETLFIDDDKVIFEVSEKEYFTVLAEKFLENLLDISAEESISVSQEYALLTTPKVSTKKNIPISIKKNQTETSEIFHSEIKNESISLFLAS